MIKICEVMGLPPEYMVLRSPKAKRFFSFHKKGDGFTYQLKRCQSWKPRSLRDILGVDTGGPSGRRLGEEGHSSQHYTSFLHLVKCMLTYEPEERITPLEALQHPFFNSHMIPSPSHALPAPSISPSISFNPTGPATHPYHPSSPTGVPMDTTDLPLTPRPGGAGGDSMLDGGPSDDKMDTH